MSPAESLPMLTAAVARPRKRPREATTLEAYILIEVVGVGGEECSRSCLCIGVRMFVESRRGTTVFIYLEKQQTA